MWWGEALNANKMSQKDPTRQLNRVTRTQTTYLYNAELIFSQTLSLCLAGPSFFIPP